MPLTPQQKNAQSYNAIKNGLNSLSKFISANGSDDLFSLFTENKKTEIDNLFFTPPRQSNPGTRQKGKLIDLLTRTGGWFTDSNKGDPANIIRENVFGLFGFKANEQRDLRTKLTNFKKNNEQTIINQLEAFEKEIESLTPEQTFIYINLYIFVRWDNIIGLGRFNEIQKSLSVKKFTPLSPENYELLKNKKITENLASQDTSHDLSFSQLGHIKDWSKVKNGILKDLVPPQTDTLSSISTPSSSTVLNTSINADNGINNYPDSINSVSITPSIDAQIVINESVQNQEIAQLKHTKKELEENSQSLETIKANLETQISELQKLLQDKEVDLNQKSEANKQQLDSLNVDLKFFQDRLQSKESEVKSLKIIQAENLAKLHTAQTKLQNLHTDTKKIEEELEKQNRVLEERQNQIKELETQKNRLDKKIAENNVQLENTISVLADKSSAHDSVSKQLSNLQTQHANLQTFLESQKKLLQASLQSRGADSTILYAEISKLNDEIELTKSKLNEASQKLDESKKTIETLQSKEFELEEQKNNLFAEKLNIEGQFAKKNQDHEALVSNYRLLKAESEIKQESLNKVERKLKEEEKRSKELKEEIEEKNKQNQTLKNEITTTHKILEERQSEFQQASNQIDKLTQQFQKIKAAEKATNDIIFEKELQIKKLKEEAIEKLESLDTEIKQEKEKSRGLSLNLNLKTAEAERLSLRLNDFHQEIDEFVQTIKSDLDKLNPPQTIIQEGQNPTELIISEEAQKALSSPIQQSLAALVSIDEKDDASPDNQITDKLGLLKLQTISTLSTLISRSATMERQFVVKNEKIAELQKELESSFTEIKILGQQVTSLNEKIHEFEQLNEQENYIPKKYLNLEEDFSYEELENSDDDDSDIQIELKSVRKLLQDTQGELQQKIDEVNYLQGQLESQEVLKTKIDTLKKSSEEALSTLEAEKAKVNETLQLERKKLEQYEAEKNQFQDKLNKLNETGSSNHEEITGLKAKLAKLNSDKSNQDGLIQELKDELNSKEQAIKNLTEQHQQKIEELVQLNTRLTDTGKSLEKSADEIDNLKTEQAELMQNDSARRLKIADLENQIEDLNKLKSQYEKSIFKLNDEIDSKEKSIDDLQKTIADYSLKLVATRNQAEQLEIAKSELENLKLDLESKIIELTKQNSDLQQELNQPAVNDKLIAELNSNISTYKNKLIETDKEIQTLKENLETKQKDDSILRDDYANLDKKLSEEKLELNKLKTELEEAKEKIKILNKNSDVINAAKQLVQQELDNLKKEHSDMKDKIYLVPNNPEDQDSAVDSTDQTRKSPNLSIFSTDQSDRSNTSSGHSSGNSSSSSPALEKNAHFFQNPEGVLPRQFSSEKDEAFFGSKSSITDPDSNMSGLTPLSLRQTHSLPDLRHLNSDDSLGISPPPEPTLESPIVPIINPRNGSNSMPRQQQDEIIKVKAGVIDAFKQENHPAIIEAFTKEFSRIATHAAKTLFNSDINSIELPDFENKLQEIAANEITYLISALSNKPQLLTGTIEKIHTNGINYSTYLEEVKNSAHLIFDTLTVKLQNKVDQKYKDHIADVGNELLINLCIEKLQTSKRDILLESAKTILEEKASDNGLQLDEDTTETITKASQESVNKLLEKSCLKNTLEEVSKNPVAGLNFLEASKQKLHAQLQQDIDQSFEHYFPILQLAPIFQKIKDNKILSEDEIQKIPSELQYADSAKEFVSGLRVRYPHLSAFEIDEDNFKKLRLILRKKAVSAINQTHINDNEIIDLSANAWLEKRLQLTTGESISLELIKLEKEQKNLLNELSSSLHLSALYDIAITGKTISDLTNEIDKSNKAQFSAAEQISQIFQEIDRKQTVYPKLIDDEAIAGFRANLNQHLENLSIEALKINDNQAKTLLIGINQHLKKDISKWDLLGNKLQKGITNDILKTNPNGFAFDEAETEKLVHHAMLVLRNNYPNDTEKKRAQWLKEITLLHITTKKLLAFSKEIETNKAKFQDLKQLKEQEPAAQALNEKISDVYLPKSCTMVANSFDPSLAARQPEDELFKLDTIFSKQNAPKINQTLTFSQTLRSNKEQKWSVSRIDDTCLTYQTHKSWLDVIKSIKHIPGNAMTYVRSNNDKQFNAEEEVLFTQLTHAVNSSKSKICKITISKNCPQRKEKFIRCFINNHNKNRSDAEPILECQDNNNLKIHKDDKINMLNKIKTASNLHDKELENANKLSNELVNRHTIRPRG